MELLTQEQTITDPAEWDGSLFGSQLELVQLAGGEFCSRQTVTDLCGVQILRLMVNQPITVRSRPLTLRYVATSFDHAHAGHYAGAAIENAQLLIMPPAFDFDACVSDTGFHCSSIFVKPDQLRSYYRTLVGEDIRETSSLTIAWPDSTAIQWLADWPRIVSANSIGSLTQHQRHNMQEALRDAALTLLVEALRSSTTYETAGDAPRLTKARSLVRLAEDFANSNPENGVRMVDLCNAAGVSERTLQYAFQACLGISPINYLKRLRLHRARRLLKLADPKHDTVSSIASECGFWHFSEFAQAYKAQFDESPSETLRAD